MKGGGRGEGGREEEVVFVATRDCPEIGLAAARQPPVSICRGQWRSTDRYFPQTHTFIEHLHKNTDVVELHKVNPRTENHNKGHKKKPTPTKTLVRRGKRKRVFGQRRIEKSPRRINQGSNPETALNSHLHRTYHITVNTLCLFFSIAPTGGCHPVIRALCVTMW